MTIRSIRMIAIIIGSINFLSCNGQVGSEQDPTEPRTLEIGKIVHELDDQIWKIFQDSKGRYWFGSNGRGLYCIEGSQMKRYTTLDGLVDNTIRGIQEDLTGNIYIETPNGISKFDGEQFATLESAGSTTNEWKLEPNDLWFGYNANDLYRYDGEFLYELELPRKDLEKAFGIETKGVPFKGNNNSPYAVFGVNKDKEGNLWFGTVTAGAYRYDGKAFLWFGEKELSTLPDGRAPGVRAMIQDKDGYFWLSNFQNKYKIDPSQNTGYEKVKAFYATEVNAEDKIRYFNAGIADNEGNLWMTTYGGRVWKYDGKTLSSVEVKNGTESVMLITIYQDHSGTIWLGTENDGAYQQSGDKFEKFVLKK